MRLSENGAGWLSDYFRDIEVADNELAEKNFLAEPKSVVCDFYVLPTHNHQTFYGKITAERGFFKIIFAKAIQNSIWFSEPIYMYRFEEAKRFENHPMKKGRIVCRAKLMDKALLNRLLFTVGELSAEQPADAVEPTVDSVFTAVRIYENGAVSREIMYTDPERLAFREGAGDRDAVDFLGGLYLAVEKIVGVGD
ncbi:MAG: hypothetical protein NC299_11495 [Lachnospiraceae bacterium]|nr:hypothetical protein [Ruminococcus sp.]MCM1275967.1 hypothetical protein [Lachnospiraceae bacterium]